MFNLFNWQGLLLSGIISAAAAGYGAYHFTAIGYQKTIADLKLKQANAALKDANDALIQFESEVAKMNGAVGDYNTLKYSLDINFANLSKEFANATKGKPLPADCVPTPDRVRSLAAAIAAANSTGPGPDTSPAVPARP